MFSQEVIYLKILQDFSINLLGGKFKLFTFLFFEKFSKLDSIKPSGSFKMELKVISEEVEPLFKSI